MSLIAKAFSAPPPLEVRKCIVQRWIEEQDQEDQAALKNVMEDDRWTAAKIYAELKKSNVTFVADTFRVHRRGTCSCDQAR